MAEWKYDQLNGEDETEEDDESTSSFQWGTKDGLIFLIDCSETMFAKEHDDEENMFDICIKCTKLTIQNKIFSSDRDLLGVVFYGTEKSNNPTDSKHIYIVQELMLPGADEVKQLEKIMEADVGEFDSQYGHNDGYSLADALWTCSNMFAKAKQKLGFKRIMLFTNNDNPHPDGQLRRQAMAKVEDLQQNGIDLELMHMPPPDRPFDVQAFYKDILFADDDEQTALPDAAEKFEELLTRVRAKNHKKRSIARIPLTLADGLSMSVGVYSLVRTCTKPPTTKLYRKTNEEVKHVTKTFLKENGEIVLPQDMQKCQVYAGRKISFELEELTQMKTFDSSGLVLMGFKPKNLIKPYFHVRPAQFLYPDEKSVKGSTVLFTALLKKCIEKGVVAVCRYTPRKNTPPRFVALFPQAEELDDRKVQIVPPGFHVIFLPFADDFRRLKLDQQLPRANAEQIEKAKELIKKLQFAFRSESFENPVLQQHYASVEAMALDRDSVEEISDFTLPDEDRIDRRAGLIVQEFKSLVFATDYQPGAKRKGAAPGKGSQKAVKTEDFDIDIEQEARGHRLGKLTLPVLRECAKKLQIKTGTKKADIIDAIAAHFGL